MMKVMLIVCVMLAVAISVDAGCNQMRRLKVMQQWGNSFSFGNDREVFSQNVWRKIFDDAPETIDQLFTRVKGHNIYSPEFKAHAARVLAGFDMSLSLLTDPDVFDAQLAHLKEQHMTLSVDAKYFDIFRSALLETVQERIGRCFDQDAWSDCVSLISDGIKH